MLGISSDNGGLTESHIYEITVMSHEEDSIIIHRAVGYVALGKPLPIDIEDHLAKLGILDMILHPVPVDMIDWGDDDEHIPEND